MSFFSGKLLHPIDDEHLLGDKVLEFGVLGFQFFQSAGIRHVHAAELVPPSKEGLLADVVALAQRFDGYHSCFCFTQDGNDLFFRKSFFMSSPCCLRVENSPINWLHVSSQVS
jgi:hypothetical protein